MKFIKKYESFKESLVTNSPAPTTKPAPVVDPGVKPGRRPSPIRRDKPSTSPAPKAKLKKSTIEEVISEFAKLTNQVI